MDTSHIKKYAPKAREQFIEAVRDRLSVLGIEKSGVVDATVTGDRLQIGSLFQPANIKHLRDRLVARCMVDENFNQAAYEQLIEQVAYTWFNRFCAIRYMELQGYLPTFYRLLSNPDKESAYSFEALIPQNVVSVAESLGIQDLNEIKRLMLDDKSEEIYRRLILAVCDSLHQTMPFLFESIGDEFALLLPANLTGSESLIHDLVNEIPEDAWSQVEIIGWLYQYYISDKKDEVIGKTVKSEDIPAATQLFTPNWIVQYLVQNSLGHYWLQTYPDSDVRHDMPYYIAPAEQDASVQDALAKITPSHIDPETITVLDPACGSGHILLEAYNTLKGIYRDAGYMPGEIPRLILEKNLYGLDIDARAAQLAGFAVMMIAVKDDRGLLREPVALNILALEESQGLDADELWSHLQIEDPEHRYQPLFRELLARFEEAKTFGSLIQVNQDELPLIEDLLQHVQQESQSGDAFKEASATILLPLLKQARLLAMRYDAVVANPPYMGNRYLAPTLKAYLKDYYQGYEKDLFSAFILGNLRLTKENGQLGFMTPFVWMFISSYEELRAHLIDHQTITSLIQLEYSGFDGATVPICTFTLNKGHISAYKGSYIKLSDFKGAQNQAPKTLEAINNRQCGWFYESKADDFKKIPGNPIAYWASQNLFEVFDNALLMESVLDVRQGLATADNNRFLRLWHEVSQARCKFDSTTAEELAESRKKWIPYNKGGQRRQWYGNYDYLVNWENDGYEIKNFLNDKGKQRSVVRSPEYHFREAITWSDITSGKFAIRYRTAGGIHDVTGMSAFYNGEIELKYILGMTSTRIANQIFNVLNPTMHLQVGDFKNFPVIKLDHIKESEVIRFANQAIEYHKKDWDAYETSWDFERLPLMAINHDDRLAQKYSALRQEQLASIAEVKRLEEANNRLFIDAYGLQDEISAEVPLNEITLTCNPHYRYGSTLTDEEREARFQSDTIAELLSYIIGCTMGRYSLDREGLVYAHAGNDGFDDLVTEGVYATYLPDEDGFVPLTSREEGWFANDATNRVYQFVRTVWGAETLDENIQFIATSLLLYALKPKKGETALQVIERYFTSQFYKDHCSTYQRTPIYWLVSSGKERAFECLFYLHRYNESSLSRMRMNYVVPLLGRFMDRLETLQVEREQTSSTAEKNRIDKAIKQLEKKQIELSKFDEKLRNYADQQITLDLDDGVKVNYERFSDILAKI